MKRLMLGLSVLCVVTLPATLPAAATDFSFTTIDFPGAEWTVLHGINRPPGGLLKSPTVVGAYLVSDPDGDNWHAFSLTKNVFTKIEAPTTSNGAFSFDTQAYGINNIGQITGESKQYSDFTHSYNDFSFVLSAGTFSYPGECFSPGIFSAHELNNNGDIAGTVLDPSGVFRANLMPTTGDCFYWGGGSGVNGARSDAWGINEAGMVVGGEVDEHERSQGFFFSPFSGNPEALLNVPNSIQTAVRGINDGGEMVGWFETAPGLRYGFLRDAKGNISTIAFPGSTQTEAHGINDADMLGRVEIVGTYAGTDGARHGFIATATNPIVNH
jgi:hypothetical protein